MATNNSMFPMGMRVLLVDYDLTSLRNVENLLKQCQYCVKTANRGREALRMLKENKTRFDIVVTEMEMPDLDGIKLLQLVGLEMNLPVIMLSAQGDYKSVRRGIENGACDFLLKPVRIQELRNIWQHVVRKNRSILPPPALTTTHEGSSSAPPPPAPAPAPAPTAPTVSENNEGNANDEDDDDDYNYNEDRVFEGYENSNEESSTGKKARLFWSVELHQKFVDAVNQLGHDKAFPKKILDIMNVEGLTREKVASHLQKYRLYLKKVKAGPSNDSSKASGIGSDSATKLRTLGLGGGYGIYRTLSGSPLFPTLAQLNTTSGLSLTGLPSSSTLQRSQFPIPDPTWTTPFKFDLSIPTPSSTTNATTGFFTNENSSFSSSENVIRGFGNQSSLSAGVGVNPSFEQSRVVPFGAAPTTLYQHNAFPPIEGNESIGGGYEENLQNQYHTMNGINSLCDVWQNNNRADYVFGSNSLMPLTPAANFDQNLMSQSGENSGHTPLGDMDGISSLFIQQNQVEESNAGNCLMDDPLLLGSRQNSSEYLEDIVGRFLKQGQDEAGDGDFAPDYSLK